jgi:predicted nucleotidyltransferase
MDAVIREKCRAIEEKHRIRILFAVENGSRAWNLESKDSDFDVRFVFTRTAKEYLRLQTSEDVISHAYDQAGSEVPQEGCVIDMVGFDLYKFCRLLLRSNPTVVEWIRSPIIYYGDRDGTLLDFVEHHLHMTALYHHYRSMCRENYQKYLHSAVRRPTYKNYLYSLRGLLCALYVRDRHQAPPSDFLLVMNAMTQVPAAVMEKLREVIDHKKQVRECDGNPIPVFDTYIESFLKDEGAPTFEKQDAASQRGVLESYVEAVLWKS